MRTSQRVRDVQASATLDINARVLALKDAGERVYDLGIGEADYPAPREALASLVEVAGEAKSRYTEVPGTPRLRAAICNAVNEILGSQRLAHSGDRADRRRDLYRPADIVVSVGSKHLQYSAVLSLCDPGDEVVLLAPYWVSYPDMVRLVGATPVVVPSTAGEGFVPPIERIADAITDRTRLVFLNSPCNPTGRVWEPRRIEQLCDLILAHEDVVLLSDEIYGQVVFGGAKHVSPAVHSPRMRERLVLTGGLSKAYSMGGWRIGHACVADADIRDALARVGANTISCAPSVTQDAAVAALDAWERVEAMRADFERRAALLARRLNAMGLPTLPPQGAFYAFADVTCLLGARAGGRTLRTTGDVAWAFLEDARVASVAGDAFGDDGHVRFSFVRPEAELEAACDALEAFVLRHVRRGTVPARPAPTGQPAPAGL